MPSRILWVTGSYFPDIGGAEWSAFANISLLKNHFGQCVLASTGHGSRVVDGVAILEIKNSPVEAIRCAIRRFRPRFVATQGLHARDAVRQALDHDCIAVYFLRAQTGLDFSEIVADPRFRVVANSSWMGKWFSDTWKLSPVLLHPPVLPWLTVSDHSGAFVSHVGDVRVKGGERVARIAKALPNRKFLVTRSWPALRAGDAWDAERIRQLHEGDGAHAVFEPEIVSFDGMPNVTVRWPCLWPKAFYAQTKILLVASKWREPYGRVVVEGLLNGLPVIVSPEANNESWAHMVYQVEDGDDPKAWAACIQSVFRDGIDSRIVEGIRKFRSTFDNNDALITLTKEVFHDT